MQDVRERLAGWLVVPRIDYVARERAEARERDLR